MAKYPRMILSRSPAMNLQGMWGYSSLTFSGTFFEASPVISNERVTACSVVLSIVRSCNVMVSRRDPGSSTPRRCVGCTPNYPSIHITSLYTCELIYRSIPLMVNRSIFQANNSSRKNTRLMKLSKVACPGANSTSTSTSLACFYSPRANEPKMPIRFTPKFAHRPGYAFSSWERIGLRFRCS